MTVTADWQVEVGGVTLGAGTDFVLTGPVTGLGNPAPRSADQERGNSAGDVAGFDVDSRRVFTVPVGVNGQDAVDGMDLLEQLKAAWSTSVADVTFDMRLPGFESVARRWYGRPRGVDVELGLLRLGYIDALCTFEALDPYGYGPAVEVALANGETAMVNPGSAPSDRYVMTVDITTAPFTFSVGGDEPPLTIETLGTVVLDGRARTAVDENGADMYAYIAPGSGWPTLAPGSHPVTLTGGTATLTYRPAYL